MVKSHEKKGGAMEENVFNRGFSFRRKIQTSIGFNVLEKELLQKEHERTLIPIAELVRAAVRKVYGNKRKS